MATSVSNLSSNESARVEDYLNDRIQSPSDLQSLASLLSDLRVQHELQQKQLAEAQEALAKVTKASNDHAVAVRNKIEAFNEQQLDIERRLMIITHSETSDEAVSQFEFGLEKLRRLEIAKGYLELLKEVENLSEVALKNAVTAPHLALPAYSRLRNIVSLLKDAQTGAEGAAPHLIDHTEKLALSLREQMRKDFSERLRRTVERMGWPGKDLVLTDGLTEEWVEGVELLLDLQEPELKTQVAPNSLEGRAPPILFPLSVMVHPLELRFKYHFSGDKPTNRLDKPEYFLSHTLDLVNTYCDFFISYLQPILERRAEKVGSSLAWNFPSASTAFITALLPMLRQKVKGFLPQVATRPQLFSHFIHELLKFDTEIRDVWNYLPGIPLVENWKGLTWEVLTKEGWFDRWLQVEKDFALSRYGDILDTADSGQIDFDGVELTATKPTKAAMRVNDLLETITDRYRPLIPFSQKLRFLIDIQITIFDQFHERLHSGLEAYLAMTSTIGRTVQGSDQQNSLESVSGLERLCRIFGSAEYLEKKMQDWSDDVFFLELWSELQDRVSKNKDGGKNVAGSMSVAEVASRTSHVVAENYNHGKSDVSDGALFDETASTYRRLRLRSESIITSTLTCDIHSSLRSYARASTWSSLSPPSETSPSYPHPPSSDLTPVIYTLSSSMSFLSRALGVAPLKRITRQILLAIQNFIWDNVLLRHTFSTAGISQLSSDVDHLCDVVDAALGSQSGVLHQGESKRMLGKLNESLLLLGLRVRSPRRADSRGATEINPEEHGGLDKQLGLWEVERRLFANNESAREVLAELEIENLTEADARAVLERRVEIRS